MLTTISTKRRTKVVRFWWKTEGNASIHFLAIPQRNIPEQWIIVIHLEGLVSMITVTLSLELWKWMLLWISITFVYLFIFLFKKPCTELEDLSFPLIPVSINWNPRSKERNIYPDCFMCLALFILDHSPWNKVIFLCLQIKKPRFETLNLTN